MKARALASAARLAKVAEAHPMLTFQPSPAMRDFVDNTEDRLILVRAANRVGKTENIPM